jgi:hypothetical protein
MHGGDFVRYGVGSTDDCFNLSEPGLRPDCRSERIPAAAAALVGDELKRPCSCEMKFIARHIQKNGGTDEDVAKPCGVSLAVVRQAKVRHMLLEGSPGNGRHGH